ncbi:hypothetical protein F4779DRAFT_618082 [Xylariaceae sp. FL0662B]|nr:hypothetical protein F4779DRAFT_618082 [Xylariaceae sp. FL0662B]
MKSPSGTISGRFSRPLGKSEESFRTFGAIISTTDSTDNGTPPQLILDPVETEADVWTWRTFVTHDNVEDADELFRQLGPDAFAICHWLPSVAQLVICSSHCRIDGVGMLILGHRFVIALADVLRLDLT